MASKYAKQLKIPSNFASLLKDFTREALREQNQIPDEAQILRFGAKYFKDLLIQRDGVSKNQSDTEEIGLSAMSDDDLDIYVRRIFRSADIDGNGFLDHVEFKKIFRSLQDTLKLSNEEIQKLLSEADENENGVIEYREFLPIAIQIIQSLKAKEVSGEQRALRAGLATDEARDVLLHGMPKDEVLNLLQEVFSRADIDGNGTLSRVEFLNCMKDADLGFTRKEINVLMSQVDADGDGKVSYEEFIPICFEILVQLFASEILETPKSESELISFFTALFQQADVDTVGILSVPQLKGIIRKADLGLTRIQITALMAEAQEDDEGLVKYDTFAKSLGGMVSVMIDFKQQNKRHSKVQEYRKTKEYHQVMGLHRHEFEEALKSSFEIADAEKHGLLNRIQIEEALRHAFAGISDRQVRAILSITDPDGFGNIDYATILEGAFEAIQWLNEQDKL